MPVYRSAMQGTLLTLLSALLTASESRCGPTGSRNPHWSSLNPYAKPFVPIPPPPPLSRDDFRTRVHPARPLGAPIQSVTHAPTHAHYEGSLVSEVDPVLSRSNANRRRVLYNNPRARLRQKSRSASPSFRRGALHVNAKEPADGLPSYEEVEKHMYGLMDSSSDSEKSRSTPPLSPGRVAGPSTPERTLRGKGHTTHTESNSRATIQEAETDRHITIDPHAGSLAAIEDWKTIPRRKIAKKKVQPPPIEISQPSFVLEHSDRSHPSSPIVPVEGNSSVSAQQKTPEVSDQSSNLSARKEKKLRRFAKQKSRKRAGRDAKKAIAAGEAVSGLGDDLVQSSGVQVLGHQSDAGGAAKSQEATREQAVAPPKHAKTAITPATPISIVSPTNTRTAKGVLEGKPVSLGSSTPPHTEDKRHSVSPKSNAHSKLEDEKAHDAALVLLMQQLKKQHIGAMPLLPEHQALGLLGESPNTNVQRKTAVRERLRQSLNRRKQYNDRLSAEATPFEYNEANARAVEGAYRRFKKSMQDAGLVLRDERQSQRFFAESLDKMVTKEPWKSLEQQLAELTSAAHQSASMLKLKDGGDSSRSNSPASIEEADSKGKDKE